MGSTGIVNLGDHGQIMAGNGKDEGSSDDDQDQVNIEGELVDNVSQSPDSFFSASTPGEPSRNGSQPTFRESN